MQIQSAEFLTSCVNAGSYPKERLPEVALLGRSNVGKSSALNSLLNRKGLAKVGKTPGKTQMVNFFRVSVADPAIGPFHIVDLPGYGYAKVPKSVQRQWGPMVEEYLVTRERLRGVVVLIDIRRTERVDHDLFAWLRTLPHTQLVLATKADKVTAGKHRECLQRIRRELALPNDVEAIAYSSHTREGRAAVIRALAQLLGART